MDDDNRIAQHFQEIHSEGEAFKSALGEMSMTWAEAEYNVYEVLLHYAQVPHSIGRAIFSGDRADTMKSKILAIAENTGLAEPMLADLKFALAQLATLNTARNRLMHHVTPAWSTYPKISPKRLIADARQARGDQFRAFAMDSKMVLAMAADLVRIIKHLQRHLKEPFKPHLPPDATTWLYTAQSADVDPRAL